MTTKQKEGAVFCTHCMKFVDSHIEKKKLEATIKGRIIEYDADVRICNECEEMVFDRDLDQASMVKAYDHYREEIGLLLPEQIKEIRQKYNLSQTSFAKVLGLGEKTIARYETGSLQDEAQNNLILLMDEVENFSTLLWKNKDRLTPSEFRSAFDACQNEAQLTYHYDETQTPFDWKEEQMFSYSYEEAGAI